jgi:hypothetical protein
MLKKQHFDEDIKRATEILKSNASIEDKLLEVLHAVEMVGKAVFDNRQNEVAIMKALNIPMVAERQNTPRKDNEA